MLKKIFLGILVLVAIGLAGFLIIAWEPAIDETIPPSRVDFDEEQIARGAELAGAGNCAVCHTAPGGEPYAGGLPIPTPFGTIYSTNITPEPDTGIGTWTVEAFVRSMREGIARDGSHLYPAFPYTHYTRVTDKDLAAIYAFIMTRPQVEAEAPENELPFPFGFRPLMAGWNLLFLDEGPYEPVAGESEEWNHGAYLVAGLGHCSACHTPRNVLGAEKEDERFDGGESEGWHAPAINAQSPALAPWTEQAFFDYLRHGFSDLHGMALGPMAEAVASLSAAPDEDVRDMAVYLATLNEGADDAAVEAAREFAAAREFGPAPTLAEFDSADLSETAREGATIFAGACGICHHQGGNYPATRPVDLALSTTVTGPDPRNLVNVVKDGVHPPLGEAGPIMPGFEDMLTDEQIAALITFVREHFGGEPVWDNLGAAIEETENGEEAS